MNPSPDVFARRRQACMERMGPNAVALFPAAPVSIRSNDVEFNYRQDSDLLYLTGFEEPQSACLLLPGHATEEYVLFVRQRDRERETWTGRRAGVEGARQEFGAQAAHCIDTLDEKIGDYVRGRDGLYYAFGHDPVFDQKVLRWLARWRASRPRIGQGPGAILDPADVVHEMRLVKCEAEITLMRQAIAIAAQAHVAAMHAVADGMHEFEIEALVDYTFRRSGATGPAYPSIVASGPNATVLHHTKNDRRMQIGDLLLLDAGAEVQGYASDITRTFPVAGELNPAQAAIYDLVLRAQQAAIDEVRPGAGFDAPHRRAVEVLVEGLLQLGVLHGECDEVIEKELYRPFYMHRTSHWLGMDVHDVGRYLVDGKPRALQAGMVLTVEPGIYIAPERDDVPPGFAGIGVRIEDDILVTPTGSEVLSAAIPKRPEEIAALR
jgi:Xaa-Pro aminopeptidase